MHRFRHRFRHALVLSVWLLFAPALGWASCGDDADRYYAKGTAVGNKYLRQDLSCQEACLEEKRYFYQRAIDLCPSHAQAHNNLASVLERLGRYREALAHYGRALSLKPDFALAYFGQGDVYVRTMAYDKAVEAYTKGLTLEPGDTLARERRELARRLGGSRIPDVAVIKTALGGVQALNKDDQMNLMGLAGLRPDRRLPLHIPFAVDTDSLLPEAQGPLENLAQALRDIITVDSDATFLIEGHTDVRGGEAYNLELSERRAQHVVAFLVQHGRLPVDRLRIKGYGASRPISTGTEAADHARNRRVEVVRLRQGELESYSPVQLDPQMPPAQPTALAIDVGLFYEDQESRLRQLGKDAVLQAGDGFRLYFEPNQPCYVYIYQIDAAGSLFRLYPNPEYGSHDNFVQARAATWAPSRTQWFELDDTPGREEIYVVASRQRREDVEDIFSRYAREIKSGVRSATTQELTIVLKTMGVKKIRPSKAVPVVPSRGEVAELPTETLMQDGMSLARRFEFQHQ